MTTIRYPILAVAVGAVVGMSAYAADPANRLDPHAPLRLSPVPDDACAICHAGPPTAADPALQLDPVAICHSCHASEQHTGIAAHLERELDPVTLERARAARLPLPDGRIACVTCHDPHPNASERPVATAQAPSWFVDRFGPVAPGSDLARLPGPALCTACHDPRSP